LERVFKQHLARARWHDNASTTSNHERKQQSHANTVHPYNRLPSQPTASMSQRRRSKADRAFKSHSDQKGEATSNAAAAAVGHEKKQVKSRSAARTKKRSQTWATDGCEDERGSCVAQEAPAAKRAKRSKPTADDTLISTMTRGRGGAKGGKGGKGVESVQAAVCHQEDDQDACRWRRVRLKGRRCFPHASTAMRRVVAFDIGQRNLGYARCTRTQGDQIGIECILLGDVLDQSGAAQQDTLLLSEDERIQRAETMLRIKRLRGRKRAEVLRLEGVDLGPKSGTDTPRRTNAHKISVSALTERFEKYLSERADRLFPLDARPDAVVIEQQSKKSIRLSCMVCILHTFVIMLYRSRGETPPPVVIQNGRQKMRVYCWATDAAGADEKASGAEPRRGSRVAIQGTQCIADWCMPRHGAGAFRITGPPSQAIPGRSPGKRAPASDGLCRKTRSTLFREAAAQAYAEAQSRRAHGANARPTTKPTTATQRKRAEEAALWRANKKYTKIHCERIMRHYPGCRRWLPLFLVSDKGDDIADAVLHAVFLLMAGSDAFVPKDGDASMSILFLPCLPDALLGAHTRAITARALSQAESHSSQSFRQKRLALILTLFSQEETMMTMLRSM